MIFIIEHLEPELFEWCRVEYEHISKIVGKNNLIFANIKSKKGQSKLKKFGNVYKKNVARLKLKNICVLSQYADKTLKTNDKNKFKYFIFGGILGDNPAKRRTNSIINNLKKNNMKFETRNLGNKQMPTDVAVYAAKKILDGKKLNDFKFIDELEIQINKNESINLNFRYVVHDGRVIVSKKLVDYLRKREGF